MCVSKQFFSIPIMSPTDYKPSGYKPTQNPNDVV